MVTDFQPLPRSVKNLWYAALLGAAIAALAVLTSLDFLLRQDNDLSIPPFLVPVIIVTVIFVPLAVLVSATWKRWGFQLTDKWIRVRHGVFSHAEAVIPRNRVQSVSTENGPLDRMLNLTSITVHTAGAGSPTISIPHLSDDTVEWLRSELGTGVDA